MRILVHEYLTGGGLWSDDTEDPRDHPLLPEGRAMAEAVSEDLHRTAGVELLRLEDARLNGALRAPGEVVTITSVAQEFDALAHWSPRVDGVLLIAPEHGGRLRERSQWVERHGGRLLSPDASFIELTTDKTRTAERLAAAGVAVPHALRLEADEPLPADFPLPAVLKPNDGVGSLETCLARSADEARSLRARYSGPRRLEAYCVGLPASVLALRGPRRSLLLPPCRQRMACDGLFHYLGGAFPLAAELSQRACRLASAALAALPPTRGYVGVDLILGSAPDGRDDVVLEVNPRLTTSYVGLRRGTAFNLAAPMLNVERDERNPLFFQPGVIEFDADGSINRLPRCVSTVP
jgi:tyramine---L-glutamate ligase